MVCLQVSFKGRYNFIDMALDHRLKWPIVWWNLNFRIKLCCFWGVHIDAQPHLDSFVNITQILLCYVHISGTHFYLFFNFLFRNSQGKVNFLMGWSLKKLRREMLLEPSAIKEGIGALERVIQHSCLQESITLPSCRWRLHEAICSLVRLGL